MTAILYVDSISNNSVIDSIIENILSLAPKILRESSPEILSLKKVASPFKYCHLPYLVEKYRHAEIRGQYFYAGPFLSHIQENTVTTQEIPSRNSEINTVTEYCHEVEKYCQSQIPPALNGMTVFFDKNAVIGIILSHPESSVIPRSPRPENAFYQN